MAQRIVVCVIGIVCLAVAVGGFITVSEAEDTAKATSSTDLQGKVLTVYERGRDLTDATSIQKVQIIELGNRPFLVGTGVSTVPESDWVHGLKVMIAVDAINSIVAFDSIDEFNTRMNIETREQ